MRHISRFAGLAFLALSAVAFVFASLAFGGGADPVAFGDPGVIVRWGTPVIQMVGNIAAAITIGSLLLTSFALSPGARAGRATDSAHAQNPKNVVSGAKSAQQDGPANDRRPSAREWNVAMDVASFGAALWTVANILNGIFAYAKTTSTPISFDQKFGSGLGYYLTGIDAGRVWIAAMIGAAIVTVLAFAVRGQTGVMWVAVLSVVTLMPLAQLGHAAGSSGHEAAVTGMGMHLLFAAIWLGGLVLVCILRPIVGLRRITPITERYSSLALVSFALVAASGVVNSAIRVSSFERLFTTTYGVLILGKVVALVALGIFGAMQRTKLLRGIRRTAAKKDASAVERRGASARFGWFVAAELIFMGMASGIAAALAVSNPDVVAKPADQLQNPTPAELLTGEKLPAPFTPSAVFTAWNFDLLWAVVTIGGIAFYLAGVIRLRRRGDSWPIYRTICWVLGMLVFFWITNGFLNVYERYLFSVHMLGHMLLSMVVPLLLVPAAPVTLGMRALAIRRDGSRGPREWMLWAVHSPFGRFVSNPVVAAIDFALSLIVFYYTPLFRWATYDHLGHIWMVAHFTIVGYLFVQSLIGVDPLPSRPSYPLRFVLLLGTMAFHAFFGVAIMMSNSLLLADWFGSMGRTWGLSPLADQQMGGGIAWSVGEIPTAILAIVTAISWSRSDAKLAKRLDRKADRSGDAELKAYNEQLRRLAERDAEDAGRR